MPDVNVPGLGKTPKSVVVVGAIAAVGVVGYVIWSHYKSKVTSAGTTNKGASYAYGYGTGGYGYGAYGYGDAYGYGAYPGYSSAPGGYGWSPYGYGVNPYGYGVPSGGGSGGTPGPAPVFAQNPVSGLHVSKKGETGIDIAWQPAKNASGYSVTGAPRVEMLGPTSARLRNIPKANRNHPLTVAVLAEPAASGAKAASIQIHVN
jgi:hypothetical protein